MVETRIGSLSANNELINLIMRTQGRINDRLVQVSSQKVSQVYSGLARDSQRLVSVETLTSALAQFVSNNDSMALRLNVTSTAVKGIEKTVKDFREALLNFSTTTVKDETIVKDIQDWAFRSLQAVQSYLSSEADGRYVFSGSRVLTSPVDLSLSTLSNFQATYDGATVTYPTTRDAHLAKFSIADDGAGNTDWLVFERDAGAGQSRITSTTAQFANVAVGTRITISGTGSNDGTYTVAAVGGGGTTLDLVTEMFTDEAAVAVTVTWPDPNNSDKTITANTTATFDRATNTLTYVGGLTNLPVGSTFTIAGSASNDGSYTVETNDGVSAITIVSKRLTDEGAVGTEVDGTIASTSYYSGDAVALKHRLDKNSEFNFDINAIDPAFEKAIRAMSLIAQGKFGTEGGLDQNLDRVDDALYLLNSSIDRTVPGTPPFGTELTSNLALLDQTIGHQQRLLNDTNVAHKRFIGFLDESVAKIENVDPADAIARLLDDQRALEATYQALARIRQLSLVNFLS